MGGGVLLQAGQLTKSRILFVVLPSSKSCFGSALEMQPLAAPRRPLALAPLFQRHSLISEPGPCPLLCLYHIPTNQRRTVCLHVWLLSLVVSCLLFVSLPFCLSIILFTLTLCYFAYPLVSLGLSFPDFAFLLSSVTIWLSACRIIGLHSHSQYLNHVVPCFCLSSAVPFPASVSISLTPTVGLLDGCKYAYYFLKMYCVTFARPCEIFLLN